MLYFLIALSGILLTIFFVIGTHEAAHFYTARLLGVKVLRFSIGFGKRLYHWYDKQGTEYVIALIPLGGYVKMLDETEGSVDPKDVHLAYNRQPFYKKFLIVLAGPLCNIFCAFVLYWLIFVIGYVTLKPIIGEVQPKSIAAIGGLKSNQEIKSIDDYQTNAWTSVMFRLLAHLGNQDQLKMDVVSAKSNTLTTHTLDLRTWKVDELTPDPLSSLGIKPYEPQIPLIIGVIAAKSPALAANLKLNDEVIAINNKPVKNWMDLIKTIADSPDKTLVFTIKREGKISKFPVTVGSKRSLTFQKSGYLGIAPQFKWPEELTKKIQYGPIEAIPYAWSEIYNFTYFNLLLFGKLFTGKLSMQSLGGPITIFESAGDALNYGFLSFIAFLAFLSISIGVINLLPIPGLDGGHLVIQIIELIIQKPIPVRVLNLVFRLGFIFLFFVLIQALINDFLRL